MKVMRMALFLLLAIVVLALAYVRLAPVDAARWHQPITATENSDMAGGAVRIADGDADRFAKIDAAARALPRTRAIAGGVDEGRVTYMTRSRVFGFPDFTTIELRNGTIAIFARLRFGQSDLGVNRARIERLIAATEG